MPSTLGIVASSHYATAPTSPFPLAPWHAACWASDPAWTPPADGAGVTSWRDGSGNGHSMAPSLGSAPTYRAATSALGGKPGIQFAGTTDLATATFTGVPFPALSLVAVVSLTTPATDSWYQGATDGANGVTGGTSSSKWWAYAGNVPTTPGGVADTGKHFTYWRFDATGSYGYVDGALVTSGGVGAGLSGPLIRWALGRWPGSGAGWCAATMGFVGFKAATLTAPEEADLLAWSRAFYGTP